jgi:hypothetical protein
MRARLAIWLTGAPLKAIFRRRYWRPRPLRNRRGFQNLYRIRRGRDIRRRQRKSDTNAQIPVEQADDAHHRHPGRAQLDVPSEKTTGDVDSLPTAQWAAPGQAPMLAQGLVTGRQCRRRCAQIIDLTEPGASSPAAKLIDSAAGQVIDAKPA